MHLIKHVNCYQENLELLRILCTLPQGYELIVHLTSNRLVNKYKPSVLKMCMSEARAMVQEVTDNDNLTYLKLPSSYFFMPKPLVEWLRSQMKWEWSTIIPQPEEGAYHRLRVGPLEKDMLKSVLLPLLGPPKSETLQNVYQPS